MSRLGGRRCIFPCGHDIGGRLGGRDGVFWSGVRTGRGLRGAWSGGLLAFSRTRVWVFGIVGCPCAFRFCLVAECLSQSRLRMGGLVSWVSKVYRGGCLELMDVGI